MPSGKYDPATASARFFGDPLKPDTGAESFANTANAAISSYRSAEGNWSSFDHQPYCAEPVFSPDSNAIKVKRGDQKQLTVYARASSDSGRATEAKWSLLAPLNADFSPTTSQDQSPTIQYTVSKSPAGDQVRVTVKVTSTAGVGEKAWTEPIESSGFEIEGSFGGEISGATSARSAERPEMDRGGEIPPARPRRRPGRHLHRRLRQRVRRLGDRRPGSPGATSRVRPKGRFRGVDDRHEYRPDRPPYEYEINLTMPFVPVNTSASPAPKPRRKKASKGPNTCYPAGNSPVRARNRPTGSPSPAPRRRLRRGLVAALEPPRHGIGPTPAEVSDPEHCRDARTRDRPGGRRRAGVFADAAAARGDELDEWLIAAGGDPPADPMAMTRRWSSAAR